MWATAIRDSYGIEGSWINGHGEGAAGQGGDGRERAARATVPRRRRGAGAPTVGAAAAAAVWDTSAARRSARKLADSFGMRGGGREINAALPLQPQTNPSPARSLPVFTPRKTSEYQYSSRAPLPPSIVHQSLSIIKKAKKPRHGSADANMLGSFG